LEQGSSESARRQGDRTKPQPAMRQRQFTLELSFFRDGLRPFDDQSPAARCDLTQSLAARSRSSRSRCGSRWG